MFATLFMVGVPVAGVASPAAMQGHAAIVLPLLALLAAVMFVGILFTIFMRRQRHVRMSTGRPRVVPKPREGVAGCGTIHSSIYHWPARWVAIRTGNQRAVQATLRLHNTTPCSWLDGIGQVNDQKVFISPPVNGWILVFGSLLPEAGEDVDDLFRFMQRLSRELGEVQYFSVNCAVGYHAWAWFDRGRALRGYAWAGEVLWAQGAKTWAERKLGMTCYNYLEGEPRENFTRAERLRTNSEKVPLLAAMWSVDPTSLDDHAVADVYGIAGELSQPKLT